MQQALKT